MTSTTPLNILDQQYLHLDRAEEPWSVHFEVRIEGHLEEDRLTAAVPRAADRHPIARARLGGSLPTDVRYHWEIEDELVAAPVEVLSDGPEARELSRARERLLSRGVDLVAPPPWELALVHGAEGDSLILNLHHAAGDGIAAVRLMRSILCAYAGQEDPRSPVDPFDVREVEQLAAPDSLSDRVVRAKALTEHLARLSLPPTRVVADGGVTRDGYGFALARFSADELASIVALRHAGATLNDVLLAGMAVTIRRWNRDRDEDGDRVSIMMPINLRPPGWRSEVVGNYATYVTVPMHSIDPSDLSGAIDTVAESTARIKREGTAGLMVDLLAVPTLLPTAVKQRLSTLIPLTGNRVVDTAVLSNLGRVDAFPDLGEGAGKVKEVWFSPPGRMPLGASLGVATLNDQLHVTLRYRHALFDADAAERFQELFRETLLSPAG
jgi:NRPS condensation-like uncharacterized protein